MTLKVELKRSGKTFEVEEDESVLTAALRQDMGLPYGCRNGACGSCRATLVSGDVSYGDHLPSAMKGIDVPSDSVILCQAKPKTDLVIDADELEIVAGLHPKILPCRVVALDRLAGEVMALSIKLPQNQAFNYMAGQYIDILLPGGKRRSYSLAHAPAENEILELHVGYVEGGLFTSRVFNEMKEKELLRFNGPLGSFFIRAEIDEPIILVAGGTGYAPIQAMLEKLFKEDDSRQVFFYMGANSKKDLYMHEQCLSWGQQFERFHYRPVLSKPLTEDDWTGSTGWVQDQILKDFSALDKYQMYVAGPPAMIHALKDSLAAAGLKLHKLFYDSFEFAEE